MDDIGGIIHRGLMDSSQWDWLGRPGAVPVGCRYERADRALVLRLGGGAIRFGKDDWGQVSISVDAGRGVFDRLEARWGLDAPSCLRHTARPTATLETFSDLRDAHGNSVDLVKLTLFEGEAPSHFAVLVDRHSDRATIYMGAGSEHAAALAHVLLGAPALGSTAAPSRARRPFARCHQEDPLLTSEEPLVEHWRPLALRCPVGPAGGDRFWSVATEHDFHTAVVRLGVPSEEGVRVAEIGRDAKTAVSPAGRLYTLAVRPAGQRGYLLCAWDPDRGLAWSRVVPCRKLYDRPSLSLSFDGALVAVSTSHELVVRAANGTLVERRPDLAGLSTDAWGPRGLLLAADRRTTSESRPRFFRWNPGAGLERCLVLQSHRSCCVSPSERWRIVRCGSVLRVFDATGALHRELDGLDTDDELDGFGDRWVDEDRLLVRCGTARDLMVVDVESGEARPLGLPASTRTRITLCFGGGLVASEAPSEAWEYALLPRPAGARRECEEGARC